MKYKKSSIIFCTIFISFTILFCSCGKRMNTVDDPSVSKLNDCAMIYIKYQQSGVQSADETELEYIVSQTQDFLNIFDDNWNGSDFSIIVKNRKKLLKWKEPSVVECVKYEMYGIRMVALLKLGNEQEYISEFISFYEKDKSTYNYAFEYNTLPQEKESFSQEDIPILFKGYDSLLNSISDESEKSEVAVSINEACAYLDIDCPERYVQIVKNIYSSNGVGS